MIGQVYKVHTDRFYVKHYNDEFRCSARAGLKKQGGILVGDMVEFDGNVISSVLTRKNRFYRPAVSNLETLVIVVAERPKPDFLLIDKLVINAVCRNLEIIFVVSKSDILVGLQERIYKEYAFCDAKVVKLSANSGEGIEQLKQLIDGKLVLLAGQSAVGKTSIINSLFGLNLKIGELSEKIERGRHTTTHSQIYFKDNLSVIDTPGFAVIDSDVTIEDLPNCYNEYFVLSSQCKYRGCTHTDEPNCKVKQAVQSGELSKERYDRYLEIYNELKTKRRLYDRY